MNVDIMGMQNNGWMPQQLSLLLIDDNEGDCLLVEEAIALQDRPVILTAIHDSADALDWLHAQAHRGTLPNVLLLDIRMPGLTGLDLLREIRRSPGLHHLPVVMLTTSSDSDDIRRAYELISSGYLVKHAHFDTFASHMKHLLAYWSDVQFPHARPYTSSA